MKVLPCLSACVLAGSLASGPAWAQPTDAPYAPNTLPTQAVPPVSTAGPAAGAVTLRVALETAWARAVSAREADGLRRRAEADRAVGDSLWAAPPSLSVDHRNNRLQSNTGQREIEVGVAVPLWMPGQRAARGATAQAALAQAQAAEAVARLRLAGEVREAAWGLAALQAQAEQALAQMQALQALADDVTRRVRAGDLAAADALAAQAEQLGAAAQTTDLQQRLQAAGARWTLLTGLAEAPDLSAEAVDTSRGGEPPAAAELQTDLETDLQTTHPELQLAQRATALARQRLELLQRSRRDAPELSFSLRQDTPGRAASAQGSLAVGLRLPLGTADRNRPLEAAALSELSVAQTQEERLRERLHSEVLSARHAVASALAQLQGERSRARLLRERAGLIDRSFRAGETPLPELLRAQAAAAQADSGAARQTAALGLARARLQHAYGQLP